ncbi:flagellar biosynthetic protein FliR [Borrelia miyamotoi]|uniref:Flagellar biosynthetic protein FliR n=1 Tax=Borrelia miyamotoi TaxID=47466 RepID=A0AAP9CFV9_9SPIR|nr:flagellar biosynthetic protein FliR [Borrelia miyamotoi]AHH05141.1 Flagellar biosynthetic protein fliR [Borrelia miyamotoi FR64b]ATQ14930.1 flagellar biosynthetic protein FliR [Borrelia miyamotoi]ATQ16113.1 flagellar biosynthetic protein FliR [Borrelia miyamotoi]ATQ17258.1 flagellar biosynthetic protein FliR [Borrelia miyamotoi]ATQ18236.1 flagellar biosynthetic protein FliR [Borrelia miyamotoi]
MNIDFLVLKSFVILPLFIRIFLFLRFSPFFSTIRISYLNFFFSLIISVIVVDKVNVIYPLDNLIAFALILLGEAILGLIQAFFVSIIFSVFHLLGFFFSNQMGLAYTNIFDVFAEEDNLVISQIFTYLFLLLFLSNDFLLRFFMIGVHDSVLNVRVENMVNVKSYEFIKLIFYSFAILFEKALVISLPILGVLLLLYLILGILSKISPQINLLMVSFSVSLGLGLIVLYIGFPSLVMSVNRVIELALGSLQNALNLFSRSLK